MKHAWKSGTMPVFIAAALLSAALLGGCGSSSQETIGPATGNVLSALTPTAGLSACAACHTRVTADWLTSKHANLDPAGDLYSAGVPTLGIVQAGPACIKCHDPNGDSGNLSAGYTGATGVMRPVIGCETCHGPGSFHVSGGGEGPITRLANTTFGSPVTLGTVTVSAQFVTCTACHELLKSDGTITTATHAPAGTAPTGMQYVITDTHYATTLSSDFSSTNGANTNPTYGVRGYAMDFAGDRVCVDCHDPHKTAEINKEWAQSAHGDRYANNSSDPNGFLSGAWSHYNWSCDKSSLQTTMSSLACGYSNTTASSGYSNRKACQRCHTTTGFIGYADALGSGDLATAEALRKGTISRLSYTSAFKPEMLKCNGCHTDNRGTLRNPGAITANYDVAMSYPTYTAASATYAKVSYTFPDLSGSNVCMACHTGRESGDSIKQLNVQAGLPHTINFYDVSFLSSHYLTAGGTIFKVTGYEFDGRAYDNLDIYRHDKIGTSATQLLWPYEDTGSNGPCIGCHMSRAGKNGNHLFLPVARDASGVTGIASAVCQKCHGPNEQLILDMVIGKRMQFKDALEALMDQLAIRNLFFYPNNPYFFTNPGGYTAPKTACTDNVPVRNWQTNGTTSVSGSYVVATGLGCTYTGNNDGVPGTGKNNMGAAFNFNLLEHDPGAYAHNRMYVKRLIYDSIDWLDDNQMNNSVGTTLNGLNPVTYPYKTEAMKYLLPYGVMNSVAAERP